MCVLLEVVCPCSTLENFLVGCTIFAKGYVRDSVLVHVVTNEEYGGSLWRDIEEVSPRVVARESMV